MHKRDVLIVCGDEAIIKVLEGIFFNFFPSLVIDTASKCEVARELLDQKKYSLLITGLNFNSDLDGIDVLRATKHGKDKTSTKVILMTEKGLECYRDTKDSIVDKALKQGADYILSKPLNPSEVVVGIHKLLSGD